MNSTYKVLVHDRINQVFINNDLRIYINNQNITQLKNCLEKDLECSEQNIKIKHSKNFTQNILEHCRIS